MTRVLAIGTGAALLAFALGALFGARLAGGRDGGTNVRQVARLTDPPSQPPPAQSTEPDGFTGVVFPRQTVELAATVNARIAEIPVQVGARLAEGEVVAKLDAESIRREVAAAVAAVRAAQAEVQAARVEHAETKDKAARLEKLGDAVSAEELETARYKVKLAAARVAAAEARKAEALARVEQLRQLLETTAVTAPFAGVVAERHVDPGTVVAPGQPIIKLISGDDLWVRFAVPEQQAGAMVVKGCVNVSVTSLEQPAPAVIESVSPQIDSASRMLVVEAKLQLPPAWQGRLPTGVAARVVAVPCQPGTP